MPNPIDNNPNREHHGGDDAKKIQDAVKIFKQAFTIVNTLK